MINTNNPAAPMTEAFTQFWSDFMSRMGGMGFTPPAQQPGPDAIKQMQRMFFDAMAKYADDYMRSPAFLEQLRQTMDNAMSMKQQVDAFIGNSLKAMQMPTRDDTNQTIAMLHGLQTRLDAIEQRLAALEGNSDKRPNSAAPSNKKK